MLGLELLTGVLSQNPETRSIYLVIFLMAWLVSWWIFEILPLGMTALIPILFLTGFQIFTLKTVTQFYADPIVFLFLGGFMIARGLEKTRLSERLALNILSLTGRSDRGVLMGFMMSTAFLSMWISNTATALIMLPIALSIIQFFRAHLSTSAEKSVQAFAVAVYLSIAYAANIGGTITPIGTPPNIVFVGYLSELYQRQIDFVWWMLAIAPVAILILVGLYFLMCRMFPFQLKIDSAFRSFVKTEIQKLGPMSLDQKLVTGVFTMTCTLWITKNFMNSGLGFDLFSDTSIAILGGLLMFVIPSRAQAKSAVLQREDIGGFPWNILLLFGGGLALAGSMESVGLINQMIQGFAGLDWISGYWLIFAVAALVLILTEIMSNVAICVVAIPVIMAMGLAQDLDPLIASLPAVICSSYAFSLPISTPPNAIVFGTGEIRVSNMLRIGIVMNIFSLVIVMSLGWFLFGLIF